jgi:hypothetical protein
MPRQEFLALSRSSNANILYDEKLAPIDLAIMSLPPTIQRRPPKSTSKPPPSSIANKNNEASSTQVPDTKIRSGLSALDILRTLTTLLALSLSLSYYLTSGDSLTFSYRPWFTHPARLKAYLVTPYPSTLPLPHAPA